MGHQACLRGFRVGYHACSRLFGELRLAKADGSYVRELENISKQALMIIDDFALEPLDALARLALVEMLEERHGRASTLMVSQLPVSSWHEVIGEPTIADAICDRIVHGAHRINLEEIRCASCMPSVPTGIQPSGWASAPSGAPTAAGALLPRAALRGCHHEFAAAAACAPSRRRSRHSAPLHGRQQTPRRQSRSLSGSQRAFRTRGGTPGHPRKSE